MVNPMAVRRIVGIIGNVISFGLFLSPVPTFRTIIQRKDVEEFSPMPYLATLFNCAVWVFYGMPFISESNVLVYTINGIGLVLEAIYLSIYFFYAPSNKRKKVATWLGGEIAVMVVLVGLICGLAHPMSLRTKIVGALAVVFGTLMYGSPMTVMKKVITTKSVEYMPFTISLVNFINGLCWTSYALLKFDIFMIIPNGSGVVLGGIQLILYGIYYKSTPKSGTGRDGSGKVVQMAETV